MRVFVAIDFLPEVKRAINQTIQELSKEAIRGNFTRTDNLHVTLAFLGEVSPRQVRDILKVMDEIAADRDSLEIQVCGFDKFSIRGEQLYWCGIKESDTLTKLQHDLVIGLSENGFSVDDKPFKPHITLGRRCIMKRTFDEKAFAERIVPVDMKVESIHLMKSERIEGKLTYSSLGEVKLQGQK